MLLSFAFFAAILLPNHGVNGVNVALKKPATQSSTNPRYGAVASRAVDGEASGDWGDGSVTHTSGENGPWWEVDLKETYAISSIVVYNRQDCCAERLSDFSVTINSVPEWTYTHTGIPDDRTIIQVPNKFGSKVIVSIPGIGTLSLAEVEVNADIGPNVALRKTATQRSTNYGGVASRAVDGNTSGNWGDGSVTHTLWGTVPWWQVDLGETYVIGSIVVYNRKEHKERLSDFSVTINSVPEWTYTHKGKPGAATIIPVPNKVGSKVNVTIPGTGSLSLAEVEVYEKELTCRPGRLALDTMVTTKDDGKCIVASLKRRMKNGTWSRSAFNRKEFEDNKTETIRRCIDTDKCYKLKLFMKDKGTGNDVIGDYKSFLDGALYAESPFELGKKDVHFIGTCD